MKRLHVPFALLVLLGLVGCQTWHWDFRKTPRSPQPAERRDGKGFTFVIHSDPPGAEVFAPQQKGGEVRLGTTPLTLTARLERDRGSGFGALFGKGDWLCYLPRDSPLDFDYNRDFIFFKTPELRLRKEGYAEERFTGSWFLPTSLKQRVSGWKTVPVARRYQETVFFRQPTSAHAATTITIDCATGKAGIRALDAKGAAGAPVGTTPLTCRIGFAPERAKDGRIVNWRVWADKHKDLWEVAQNGDLFLNAILERAGYAPEKVRRRICNCGETQPAQQTALFQMIRPTQPEAEFVLSLDSLPSQAAVYILNPDGSLGSEFGKTPLSLKIGMAQESMEDGTGRYLHKDWRLWAPVGLVRWDLLENGGLVVKLTCAVYKDGFAVENVIRPIFELRPGSSYPQGLTITVPLPSAEQAAVREAHRLQQSRAMSVVDDQPRRPARVWQEPPQVSTAAAAEESALDEDAEEPRRNWFGRLWHHVRHGKGGGEGE